MSPAKLILLVYAAVNLAVFAVYGADKLKAKSHKWRISEAALMWCGVFGIVGALSGMAVFRHKIRKPKFFVGLPLILAAETAAAAVVYLYRLK